MSNALIPNNINQAMDLAKMMAGSKLVPTALQDKPADCLLVIEQAMRWGMSPFAVAQCASVIHGKLMYEGKLVAAVVNSTGNLDKRLAYNYEGSGDNRKIIVSGRLNGEPNDRTIEAILKDVKTSNEVWKKQPDQQLMYAGVRIWARRHKPELMLGVYTEDEMPDNRPQPHDAVPLNVPAIEAPQEEQPSEPKTIVLEGLDGDSPDWMNWASSLVDYYKKSRSITELERWAYVNNETIQAAKEKAPRIHDRIMQRFSEYHNALTARQDLGCDPETGEIIS